jgi:hypothetical protein
MLLAGLSFAGWAFAGWTGGGDGGERFGHGFSWLIRYIETFLQFY